MQNSKISREPKAYVSAAVFAVLMFPALLFSGFTGSGTGLLHMAMLLAAALFGGVFAQRGEFRLKSVSTVVSVAFPLWYLVSRVALGDSDLLGSVSRIGYTSFAMLICFFLPKALKSDKLKRTLLITVLAVLNLGAMAAALCSVLFCVFCPGTGGALASNFVLTRGRLYIHSVHPNCIGAFLCVGAVAAIALAALIRKKALRVFPLLSIVFILGGITLVDSRTSTLACGACIGAAAALALHVIISGHGLFGKAKLANALRVTLCSIVGLAVLLGVMFSVAGMAKGFETLGSISPAAISAQLSPKPLTIGAVHSDAAVSDEDEESKKEEIDISHRGFGNLHTLLTLTDRTVVYEHAFEIINEKPSILLFGRLYDPEDYRFTLTSSTGKKLEYVHLHNYLLSVLMETGLIGLLLALTFSVLCIINCAKLFFGKAGKYTYSQKLLTLFPASIMVISMLEPVLFCAYPYQIYYMLNLLFFLINGYIDRIVKESAAEN